MRWTPQLRGQQCVGVVYPLTEQGTGIAWVNDVLDPEAFGGTERRANGVKTCANFLEESCRVGARFQFTPICRLNTAFNGQRTPVSRRPGIALDETVPVGHASAADAEDAAQNNLRARNGGLIDSRYCAYSIADSSLAFGIASNCQSRLVGQCDNG